QRGPVHRLLPADAHLVDVAGDAELVVGAQRGEAHVEAGGAVADDLPPGVDLLPLTGDGDPDLHLLAVRGVGGAPEDAPGAQVASRLLVRLGVHRAAAEEGERNPRTLPSVVRATSSRRMLGGSIHTSESLHGWRTDKEGESAHTA